MGAVSGGPEPAASRAVIRLRLGMFCILSGVALALAPPLHAQSVQVPLPRISPHLADDAARPPGTAPAGGTDATAFADEANPDTAVDTGDAFDSFGEDAAPQGDAAGDQPIDLSPVTAPLDAAPIPLDPNAPLDLAAPVTAPAGSADSPQPGALGSYSLEAKLTPDTPAIPEGVMWRVFADEPTTDGKMRLVGEAKGGPVTLKLRPGSYYVHASYGHAGITRKVTIAGDAPQGETVVLNAGGLRLTALVSDDQPVPTEDLRFDIYAPDDNGADGRVMVMENAPEAEVIGLNAGVYHVVCRYGDANAVVRADIKVEPGKLTEATVYQKAARLTLKLVEDHGGEALANTLWSVVTPAGESVIESVGAFPSVVLSAGDYTAIAKHDGKIFEQNFTVEAGLNRDVEVLLK